MPQLEFVGQSARDSDNIQANSSRLVNLYREPTVPGGRTAYVLKSVLGGESFAGVGGVFVRALDRVGSDLYTLCNGHAFKIVSDGTVTDLGAATDSAQASISGNNGDATFCIGAKYYRWNGSALNEPTTGAFSDFGSVDFFGGYTILTELTGNRFQWSALANANSLPGLNFSSADGRDDNITRAVAMNGLLYLFKERSHEIWYLTGEAGANAFARQAGGVVDLGLKAFNLICKFPGGAFMVGNDGKAHLLSGAVQPVSTPPVETAIKDCGPTACLAYEDEGHTFLCIIFRDCPAWCYDLSTGEWHERGQDTDLGAWKVSASAKMGDAWYVGRDGGEIIRLSRSDSDAGLALAREAVSRTLYSDGARPVVHELELFPRQGFVDATIELSVSRDGGITWTAPKARTVGPVGDYGQRVIWRALGAAREFTVKVRVSDAVNTTMAAEARVRL